MPFLENVTAGRNVPRQRLEKVAEQYMIFGGKSPINDQNRELIKKLHSELEARSIGLPIYFANRNWSPYLSDVVSELRIAGVRSALAFVTSAYASYSGCRQYREDIQKAVDQHAPGLRVHKIRHYYSHPGFVGTLVESTRTLVKGLADSGERRIAVVCSAHSIPLKMALSSEYQSQLLSVRDAISAAIDDLGLSKTPVDMVFQSRSGPPSETWLGPDINDKLTECAQNGFDTVVVVPIGFVSDHMEVLYDLDIQAAQTAKDLGIRLHRVPTASKNDAFISMAADLIQEQIEPSYHAPTYPGMQITKDSCEVNCCLFTNNQ